MSKQTEGNIFVMFHLNKKLNIRGNIWYIHYSHHSEDEWIEFNGTAFI